MVRHLYEGMDDDGEDGKEASMEAGRPAATAANGGIEMTSLVLGAGVVVPSSLHNQRTISGGSNGGGRGGSGGGRGSDASGAGGALAAAEEEEDGPNLSWPGCFVWMTVVTAAIAVLSQWTVDAIEV